MNDLLKAWQWVAEPGVSRPPYPHLDMEFLLGHTLLQNSGKFCVDQSQQKDSALMGVGGGEGRRTSPNDSASLVSRILF